MIAAWLELQYIFVLYDALDLYHYVVQLIISTIYMLVDYVTINYHLLNSLKKKNYFFLRFYASKVKKQLIILNYYT